MEILHIIATETDYPGWQCSVRCRTSDWQQPRGCQSSYNTSPPRAQQVLGAIDGLGRQRAAVPRTFLLFLMVTRCTPSTPFMPSFCIAFRAFFSDRLCLPRRPPSPSSVHTDRPRSRRRGNCHDLC